MAISEKVVLRLEDLLTWITIDTEWSWGRCGVHERDVPTPPPDPGPGTTDADDSGVDSGGSSAASSSSRCSTSLNDTNLDFSDVDREKKMLSKDFFIF